MGDNLDEYTRYVKKVDRLLAKLWERLDREWKAIDSTPWMDWLCHHRRLYDQYTQLWKRLDAAILTRRPLDHIDDLVTELQMFMVEVMRKAKEPPKRHQKSLNLEQEINANPETETEGAEA